MAKPKRQPSVQYKAQTYYDPKRGGGRETFGISARTPGRGGLGPWLPVVRDGQLATWPTGLERDKAMAGLKRLAQLKDRRAASRAKAFEEALAKAPAWERQAYQALEELRIAKEGEELIAYAEDRSFPETAVELADAVIRDLLNRMDKAGLVTAARLTRPRGNATGKAY